MCCRLSIISKRPLKEPATPWLRNAGHTSIFAYNYSPNNIFVHFKGVSSIDWSFHILYWYFGFLYDNFKTLC